MDKETIKNEIQEIITNADGEITSDEIYDSLQARVDPGRTQETIRTYVRELVNDSSALIGSSSNGYFKISTKKDALRAIQYIENRIPELEERVSNLRESWNNENPEDSI
ncbi:MAG: hypothetical protein U5K72_10015 [Balneolaceae bacterium]|nr:hypothetical protein [Balneolaceae bacterium]